MENSPWALAFTQIVVLIFQALLYTRQRGKTAAAQLDMVSLESDMKHALVMVGDAKRGVEQVEVTHYKRLAALHDAQQREIEALRAQVVTLRETVDSLSNKLASRERADRYVEKSRGRKASENDDGDSAPSYPRQMTIDEMIANGLAVPLAAQPAAQPAHPVSSFGRKAV